MTPDEIRASIYRAAELDAERQRITEASGLRIAENGRIEQSVRKPVQVVCGCLGCRYVASALEEGRALRAWAHHRIRVHVERKLSS